MYLRRRLVVDNDTQASSRRANILLRRVVVPSWMLVLVLAVWVVVMVKLIVAQPLLMLLVLVLYGALIFVEARRQRLRPGRGSTNYEEVQSAPTRQAALVAFWRQLRTYPVWGLIVIALAMADVVSSWLGYPSI